MADHRAPLAALCCALVGCTTLPHRPDTRALYVDLRKAVELSEDVGWVVDRLELQDSLEDALRSVCQVTPDTAETLSDWLVTRIEEEGGPAEAQYLEYGEDASIGEVLTIERTHALLRLAQTQRAEDCPFWLQPDPEFRGVENDGDRTVALFESQGYGAILIQGDDSDLSGGGGGRLLLGRGLSPRMTLAAGIEVGGSGALNTGNTDLDISINGAVPVVLRIFDVSRVFDLEVGPIARFADGGSFIPGVRASIGGGFSAMRRGEFMPYVLLWLGYEGHGLFRDEQVTHSLRIGTRVGFDWDPSAN